MKKIIYKGNKNIIGKALRENRIKRGLTQEELAAKMQTLEVNLDQQMISKIEANARFVTDYELMFFCKALEVDIKDMLAAFCENEKMNK